MKNLPRFGTVITRVKLKYIKVMKKLIGLSLGLSLVAMTLTTKAQDMKLKLGIKAGVNLMTGGDFNFLGAYYPSSYVPGFQVGAFLDFPMSSKISLAPEVLYAQKSAKYDATFGTTTGEIKTKVGYIDVPVLIKFMPTPQFNVVIGPQASFVLNQKTTTSVNGTVTATNEKTEDFNKSLVGGVVGAGYTINPNIGVNLRYTMDFQQAAKENTQQDKAKFSGFELSLGYSF